MYYDYLIDWNLDIGFTHRICQDYLFTNGNAITLSDGVSDVGLDNSLSDFGSRIISIVAIDLLRKGYHRDSLEFQKLVWVKAKEIARALNLKDEHLSATLITMQVLENGFVEVRFFGDGNLIVTGRNGVVYHHHMDYSCEADKDGIRSHPYLLRYSVNNEFLEELRKNRKLVHTSYIDGVMNSALIKNYDEIPTFLYDPQDIQSVIITSDGLGSFICDKRPVSVGELGYLLGDGVIGFNKSYIRRNIRRLKEICGNHYDDLSVGGIICQKSE